MYCCFLEFIRYASINVEVLSVRGILYYHFKRSCLKIENRVFLRPMSLSYSIFPACFTTQKEVLTTNNIKKYAENNIKKY